MPLLPGEYLPFFQRPSVETVTYRVEMPEDFYSNMNPGFGASSIHDAFSHHFSSGFDPVSGFDSDDGFDPASGFDSDDGFDPFSHHFSADVEPFSYQHSADVEPFSYQHSADVEPFFPDHLAAERIKARQKKFLAKRKSALKLKKKIEKAESSFIEMKKNELLKTRGCRKICTEMRRNHNSEITEIIFTAEIDFRNAQDYLNYILNVKGNVFKLIKPETVKPGAAASESPSPEPAAPEPEAAVPVAGLR